MEEVLENIKISYQCVVETFSSEKCIKSSINNEMIALTTDSIKVLRNSCARGRDVQNFIISLPGFFETFKQSLAFTSSEESHSFTGINLLKRMIWQVFANLCVQNMETQEIIWEQFRTVILSDLEGCLTDCTDMQVMIIYNIYQTKSVQLDEKVILKLLLTIWDQMVKERIDKIDFALIFLEHLITQKKRIVMFYGPLEASDRILMLQFLSDYIRNDSPNGPIEKTFLEYISKEFKKKSDCVLKTVKDYVNEIHPKEVLWLLDVISKASGTEIYSQIYSEDHSLFLNVGALLQNLVKIGKSSKNIFTPMQKLDEVAPTAKISTGFEKEISFELKTMLVRTLANLSYRNPKNQEYAREMEIIMAILDCTTVDARNPLVKEWSILAIRNLCENCPENQEIIRQLCKVADAPNDILQELNIQMGSLRIRPNA